MKPVDHKKDYYMFGNTPKTLSDAEEMIKHRHGETTKEYDEYNRTLYKNKAGKTVARKDRDGEGDLTWNIKGMTEMSLFDKYKSILEVKGTEYNSGAGYTARVVKLKDKHIAKFFKDGKHMTDADYEGKDEADAHEFAQDEMAVRAKPKSESLDPKDYIEQALANIDINAKVDGEVVSVHSSNKTRAKRLLTRLGHTHRVVGNLDEALISERINLPQGHQRTADPISNDAINNRGRVKKMMGNRTPIEIIAKILAGKKR